MKTTLSKLLVMLMAVTVSATSLEAQQGQLAIQQGPAQTAIAPGQQQLYVTPPQRIAPPVNPFYFGMDLELYRQPCGTIALKVVSVTPGSPAFHAGLEYGDQIITVNGRGFYGARDSFEAVRMLNQFVARTGGPAPAQAAPAQASPAVGAFVTPRPFPQPQPIANMVVRNVRNGHRVAVTVFPQQRFGNVGINPAPAAPAIATSSAYRR